MAGKTGMVRADVAFMLDRGKRRKRGLCFLYLFPVTCRSDAARSLKPFGAEPQPHGAVLCAFAHGRLNFPAGKGWSLIVDLLVVQLLVAQVDLLVIQEKPPGSRNRRAVDVAVSNLVPFR